METLTRTTRITLTAAELTYLISLAGTSSVAAMIGLTSEDATEAMHVQGRASLAVRGLLVTEGTELLLGPAVTAIATGLTSPRVTVQIGLIAAGTADSAMFLDAGEVRLLIEARMMRTYQFTGLETVTPMDVQILAVVDAFLDVNRPGVAVAETTRFGGASDGRTTKGGIAVTAEGAWSFIPDPSGDAVTPVADADQARELLGTVLR